ncbi:PHO85 cyclin-5 [Coemansia spiralis]|nr:PHO85 cyclin-5 [Coemansia spiralis]
MGPAGPASAYASGPATGNGYHTALEIGSGSMGRPAKRDCASTGMDADDDRAACAPEWSRSAKRVCDERLPLPRGPAMVPELAADHAMAAAAAAAAAPSGVRINDLLNPVAGPGMAAAHRMTVPSTLARSHSDDSKHYYQQLAQLQLQSKQQQLPAIDPTTRFARTATAPSGLTVATAAPAPAGSCTQGLIREALTLDKLYDIACVIIESIWPGHSLSQRTQLCSLRCFVAETHRQSRLGADALELAMFYLLRAKSIIQAKQRAQQDKEQKQQQPLQLVSTPVSPVSTDRADSAVMVVPADAHSVGTAAVPSGSITSPLGSSPITPVSAQQTASQLGSDAALDKQHQLLLANGVITPVTPQKAQRPLAGTGHSLPNSFRGFVVPTMAPVAAPVAAAPAAAPVAAPAGDSNNNGEQPAKPKSNVTKCGRRMFVAALISASKFMYDQTYPNKSWNRITKLPPRQISDMERAFLDMIDYRLYVDSDTYDKFRRLLARSGMRNGRLMVCDASAAASQPRDQPHPQPQHYQVQQQQQQQQQNAIQQQQKLGASLPSPQTPGVPMSIAAYCLNSATSV